MSTIRDVEFKCPVCGEKFIEMVQMSFSTFGLNLDSMPHGAAIVPNPIARCPSCGFTEGAYSKDDDELLIKYIKENNFNQYEPHYYSLAKIYEFLNRDDELIAETYLKAFWESLNNYGYKHYDDDCIKKMQKLAIEKIDKIQVFDRKHIKYHLIKLDLIRRLGEFDRGLSLIDEIKNKDLFGLANHDLANADNFSNESKSVFELSKNVIDLENEESSKNYKENLYKLLEIHEELIKNKDQELHL